jgi:hypothetical protein
LHLHLKVYTSHSQVPQAWHTCTGQHSQMHLAELAIVEQSNIKHIKPLYIMAYNNNELVACVYGQVLHMRPNYISQQLMSNIVCLFSNILLRVSTVNVLVIGHLLRHDGTFICTTPAYDAQASAIIFDIASQLQQQYKHTAFFIKDLLPALAPAFTQDARYMQFTNDYSMQLQLPQHWQSFAHYKQALKHKYTQRCTKMQKSFTTVIKRELQASDIQKLSGDIHKLYLQVTAKQSITLGQLSEQYVLHTKQVLGDRYKVYGYFVNEKLIAFASATVHQQVYDMNYIGFDYSVNQQYNLYFNLLFDCISHAIQHKCHTLILGRTALEAKAIIGCTAVPAYGFYTINNSIVNAIAKRFVARTATEQGEAWRNRHPFKQSGGEAADDGN